MSNHTPNSPWDSRFGAEVWLQGIIAEEFLTKRKGQN